MSYDVIIIGGSYAGLSAGLQLARARRSVLVIDSGLRRNRFADSSHGFLTQDGTSPAEIAAIGKTQLIKYKTVEWLEAKAEKAEKTEHGFRVLVGQDEWKTAKKIILATGIKDDLPDVPGLTERWGKSIFHCPFCHGYELDQKNIGVLAVSADSMHHALMLPDWGPTTFFLNGTFTPDAKQMAQLERRGVKIESVIIDRFEGENANVKMSDGRIIELEGMFVMPKAVMTNPIAEQLGCEIEESPFGATIKTDAMKATNIQGVYSAGDAARIGGSVTFAVADGAMAAISAYRSLLEERI